MKKILIVTIAALLCLQAGAQQWGPSDKDATPQAKALFSRLQKIQKKGCMYGHQDDLVTGRTWWEEPGRSDTKESLGDFPGVVGFELGELELGGIHSLDSVNFYTIVDRLKWFHAQNGIITLSWHVVNPISSQWPGIKEPNGAGSAWEVDFLSAEGDNAVRSVLPGGCNHAMFNSWLDRLSKFMLCLKDQNGDLIPVLFRPYHEHSGSFFWWGKTRCTNEEYASLYRYTVDYLRAKGCHHILFMYNTDKVYSAEEYLEGYPGDDYVDVLSIDWYGSGEEFNKNVDAALKFTTDLAAKKHKLHSLSECGPLSTDLQKILKKYESSYVLTWRNSPGRGHANTGFNASRVPDPSRANAPRRPMNFNAQQQVREDPMKVMKADKHYLFLQDIQNIK